MNNPGYAEILDTGKDSDAEELMELMELLGKSSQDVAADLQKFASWNHLKAVYATSDEKWKILKAAKKVLDKATLDLATFKAGGGYDPQRDIDLSKEHGRFNQAECFYRASLRAEEQMQTLKRDNPDLFINKSV